MTTLLHIASYNICHCGDFSVPREADGGLPVSVEKTAAMLSSLHADICGLQEVYRLGPRPCFVEQAARLAEKMDYPHHVYAKGQLFEWGDEIGNAVISRYPILRHSAVPVPQPTESERRPNEKEWYEDRVLLETEIRLPDGRSILFMTTHFGLNGLERERMVAAVCERIDRAAFPVILVGDFNAKPDDPGLAPIRARLTDTARALGNGEFTFASYDPRATIDYVFASPCLTPVDFRVTHAVVSDHMPVTATLEYPD